MNEILEQLKMMSRRELLALIHEAVTILEAREDESSEPQKEIPQDAPLDEPTQTTA